MIPQMQYMRAPERYYSPFKQKPISKIEKIWSELEKKCREDGVEPWKPMKTPLNPEQKNSYEMQKGRKK